MKNLTCIGLITLGLLNYSCDQKTNEQKGETVDAAEERNDTTLVNDDKKDDAEFMVKAANGGLLEVEAGTIAQKISTSKDVKDFAKQMIEDHTKANTELKAFAAKKSISLPDSVDVDAKGKLDKLKEKKGKEFDASYLNFMVDDHKEDVSLFEDASKDTKDPELKALIDKTLPTLRHHLQMAQEKDSLLEVKNNKTSMK